MAQAHFFVNENSVFSIRPSSLPRKPLECIILDNWVFDTLIQADKLFAKAVQKFETSRLLKNN